MVIASSAHVAGIENIFKVAERLLQLEDADRELNKTAYSHSGFGTTLDSYAVCFESPTQNSNLFRVRIKTEGVHSGADDNLFRIASEGAHIAVEKGEYYFSDGCGKIFGRECSFYDKSGKFLANFRPDTATVYQPTKERPEPDNVLQLIASVATTVNIANVGLNGIQLKESIRTVAHWI